MKNTLNKFLLAALLTLSATQVYGQEAKQLNFLNFKNIEKSITDKFNQIKKQDKKALVKFTTFAAISAYLGIKGANQTAHAILKLRKTYNPNAIAEEKYKLAWGLSTQFASLLALKFANDSLEKKA